ncbi:hypothetical protein HD806DRAFT_515341 [Xylariaceae sp. AK1471]|nr:hypothetical protein HD806DRAFT_515341 [Xylariaceae sp. AK1471]
MGVEIFISSTISGVFSTLCATETHLIFSCRCMFTTVGDPVMSGWLRATQIVIVIKFICASPAVGVFRSISVWVVDYIIAELHKNKCNISFFFFLFLFFFFRIFTG